MGPASLERPGAQSFKFEAFRVSVFRAYLKVPTKYLLRVVYHNKDLP